MHISEEVQDALTSRQPIVALESTVIAHGLPRPLNLQVARELEQVVRANDAVPATIAVVQGEPVVGLNEKQLCSLAEEQEVLKAATRDLAFATATKRTAATTVSATMFLAHKAGIRIFATGGIGGVHRDADDSWDVSADLLELARTPVAVFCAGAKSILDIPKTLEVLETHGVPVLGYQTDDFPAFYLRSSHQPVSGRCETPENISQVIRTHWQLNGAGIVVAQPIPKEYEVDETCLPRHWRGWKERPVKRASGAKN